MTVTNQFLINHGLSCLFAAIFVEQLGVPLPAFPWLLAAGALGAAGKLNPSLALATAVLACVLADGIWFQIGRYRGAQVLGFLCRISLEPDSCVRRTQNIFTRYGLRGLLVSKFVPGLNTVAPPLAAMAGIPFSRFLLVDAAGSLLYGVALIGLGYVFTSQISEICAAITQIGGQAFLLFAIFAIGYVAWKYWQRRRLLNELRTTRITVEELRQKLDNGEQPVIIDLRSGAELQIDPVIIRGAVHVEFDQIESHALPPDCDIIVYCDCPNEVTSARVALTLKRKGIMRVRPLQGGIAAWRKQNYPTDLYAVDTGGGVGKINLS
jgi:membrane protein DedA with SNARE-associated domain/rhodanese-related sulfurtransferase